MRFREHDAADHRPPPAAATPGPTGPGSTSLDGLQQEGQQFLAAANAIVNAALSSDSEAFLAANRQQGGQ